MRRPTFPLDEDNFICCQLLEYKWNPSLQYGMDHTPRMVQKVARLMGKYAYTCCELQSKSGFCAPYGISNGFLNAHPQKLFYLLGTILRGAPKRSLQKILHV